MAPFYRYEVFHAFAPYLMDHISGYGVDVYLVPTIQNILNLNNTAVVHKIQIKHIRPIRSDSKVFSNSKTGLIESNEMKFLANKLFKENKHLFDNKTFKDIISTKISSTISLNDKFKRVPVMVKNIYKELVNHSYR
jgi:non-homologous end joining protein Ku